MTTDGENTGSSHQDELLTRLYQQMTYRQAGKVHGQLTTPTPGWPGSKTGYEEHTAADEDQAHACPN